MTAQVPTPPRDSSPATGTPLDHTHSATSAPPALLAADPYALLVTARTAGPDATYLLTVLAALATVDPHHGTWTVAARQHDIVDALAGYHRGWNSKKLAAASRHLHDLGYLHYRPGSGRGSGEVSISRWHLTCPHLFAHTNTSAGAHFSPAAPTEPRTEPPPGEHAVPTTGPESDQVGTTISPVYDMHAFRNKNKHIHIPLTEKPPTTNTPPVEGTFPPPPPERTPILAGDCAAPSASAHAAEPSADASLPRDIRDALVRELDALGWWDTKPFLTANNWHLLIAWLDYRRANPHLNGGWVRNQVINQRTPQGYQPHAPVNLTADGYATLHHPTPTIQGAVMSHSPPPSPPSASAQQSSPPENPQPLPTHTLLATLSALPADIADDLRHHITARARETLPSDASAPQQAHAWRCAATAILTEHGHRSTP